MRYFFSAHDLSKLLFRLLGELMMGSGGGHGMFLPGPGHLRLVKGITKTSFTPTQVCDLVANALDVSQQDRVRHQR